MAWERESALKFPSIFEEEPVNILVVEDERAILDDLIEMIQNYDSSFRCIGCETPSAALEAIEDESFNLAFLDIQMPEMTGVELAHALTRECPWLKIIFVTAYNTYAAEAFELEILDYLLKPVRQERLAKALDKAKKNLSERRKPGNLMPQPLTLKIQAFGSLVVSVGTEDLKWKRQKSAELFAYLLDNLNHPVSKYRICTDVFPDYDTDRALVNLQTAIYQLRKNLSQLSREQIKLEYFDNNYRMTLGDCSYDVAEFERACAFLTHGQSKAADANERRNSLIQAYNLYKDRFLVHDGWLWSLTRQIKLEKTLRSILIALIDLAIETGSHLQTREYLARLGEIIGEDALDLKHYLEIRNQL